MRKLWSEPYLWIHAAGIVVLPVWLWITVMGLASGDPWLPVRLERLFIEAVGILPVVWMQATRPFYIFSILAVALPPDQLTPERRQVLSGFRWPQYRWIVILTVAVIMAGQMAWLYDAAPLFAPIALFPGIRWLGVLAAMVGFLGANLFIQIPAAAGMMLVMDDQRVESFTPVEVELIEQEFTVFGKRIPNLLDRFIYHPPTEATDEAASEDTTADENQVEASVDTQSATESPESSDSTDEGMVAEPEASIEVPTEDQASSAGSSLENSPIIQTQDPEIEEASDTPPDADSSELEAKDPSGTVPETTEENEDPSGPSVS